MKKNILCIDINVRVGNMSRVFIMKLTIIKIRRSTKKDMKFKVLKNKSFPVHHWKSHSNTNRFQAMKHYWACPLPYFKLRLKASAFEGFQICESDLGD